jgi:alpha-mannosidase
LDQWVQQVEIEFIAADVPACGYKAYRVTPCAEMPVYDPWDGSPENGWQPVFEDCGDVGDEYLHRKPARDLRIEQPVLNGGPVEERNALRCSRFYVSSMNLPAAAVGVESRAEDLVACVSLTRVTRWRHSDRLEYETTFDNQARDHRLRVCFQNHGAVPFNALPYSSAEGQFDVVRRLLVHPLADEGASTFYPQQNWVALSGRYGDSPDIHTVAVINQGLPEYEIYPAASGAQIAVTLLRGVNYISRRGDGPQLETPEAQCIGGNTYRYALLETRGGWEEGAVWKQSWQFNAPLRAVQTGGAGSERTLPGQLSFVTLTPDTLVVTALKRAEDNPRQVILRFFNISDQAVTGGVVSLHGAGSAAYANLNEEVLEPLAFRADGSADGSAALKPIRPKEIVTLMAELNVE